MDASLAADYISNPFTIVCIPSTSLREVITKKFIAPAIAGFDNFGKFTHTLII